MSTVENSRQIYTVVEERDGRPGRQQLRGN